MSITEIIIISYLRNTLKHEIKILTKMIGLKYLVVSLLVVAISTTQASNKIYKIAVNTANCEDCGMSNTFGALRMQVLIKQDIYLQFHYNSLM